MIHQSTRSIFEEARGTCQCKWTPEQVTKAGSSHNSPIAETESFPVLERLVKSQSCRVSSFTSTRRSKCWMQGYFPRNNTGRHPQQPENQQDDLLSSVVHRLGQVADGTTIPVSVSSLIFTLWFADDSRVKISTKDNASSSSSQRRVQNSKQPKFTTNLPETVGQWLPQPKRPVGNFGVVPDVISLRPSCTRPFRWVRNRTMADAVWNGMVHQGLDTQAYNARSSICPPRPRSR
jgi:hypothetical protein